MQGFTVHEIDVDCQVWATRPMPPLPGWLEAEIDRHWAAAQDFTGGKLFNGRIFCADVITPKLICGHWSEYRREVAQLARHDLWPVLAQRSLAVGGRSANAVEASGMGASRATATAIDVFFIVSLMIGNVGDEEQ